VFGAQIGLARSARWLAVRGLVLVSLGLAACGTTASGTGGGSSISLSASDYQFSPSTLSVPANTSVTVTIKNDGAREHNFSVTELGVDKDVDKGGTQTVTFTTKDNATLTFFCKYHVSSNNMKGTVTVGSGGTGSSGGTSPAPSSSYSGGYSY